MNLLIMPANGRWDLIRRLKVNVGIGKQIWTESVSLREIRCKQACPARQWAYWFLEVELWYTKAALLHVCRNTGSQNWKRPLFRIHVISNAHNKLTPRSSAWAGKHSRYNDWLRAGRSGDRILVEARFSAPLQTGPGPIQPPVQWVPDLSRG